jgi:predicted DCC family thiol-disulfide oxidoreductase YuxK
MKAPMPATRPPLWNPLVCGGTPLPVRVVLTWKLIAWAALLSGEARRIPEWEPAALALLLTPFALGVAAAAAGSRQFLPDRLRPYLVWTTLAIGSAMVCLPRGGSLLEGYVVLAAALLFVRWPRELTVIYDADCGICNASRRFWQRVDFERAFHWAPFQSRVGDRWNIPVEALRERAHVVAGDRITAGFRAVKRVFQYNPVTWFLVALVVAAPPNEWLLYRRIVVAILLLVFSRPFEPVGEAAYRWVARNRYRLSADGACALPPKQ